MATPAGHYWSKSKRGLLVIADMPLPHVKRAIDKMEAQAAMGDPFDDPNDADTLAAMHADYDRRMALLEQVDTEGL